MFNLDFQLNRQFILATAARSVAFDNSHHDRRFLVKCNRIAQLARLSTTSFLLIPDSERVFCEFLSDIDKIGDYRETRHLLQEAQEFQLEVMNQWSENRKRIEAELIRILRIPLPKAAVKVYTTHPSLGTGYAVPQLHAICWGHSEEFPNYHSVYLVHELLHLVLPSDAREIDHALIELIADNELRIRLNGSGKYFEYPGHKHLASLERRLLPQFREYMRRRSGSIWTLIRKCQRAI